MIDYAELRRFTMIYEDLKLRWLVIDADADLMIIEIYFISSLTDKSEQLIVEE